MSNPIVEELYSLIGKDMRHSASPVGRWLNGTLLSVEEGKLRVELIVRPEMTNPMRILHGGASAMIIDEMIGMAVYSLNHDYFFTTVNLSLDFLAPAQEGERIIAVAEIIRRGKTIVNAECRLLSETGNIIAKGMSNLVRTALEKPKKEEASSNFRSIEEGATKEKKAHKKKDAKKKTHKAQKQKVNKTNQ